MKLEDAKKISDEVLKILSPLSKKLEVVGSIRRKKPEVNDIDIVIIPSEEDYLKKIEDAFKGYGRILLKGEKIVRIETKWGISVDIYIANPATYETIKLIRTGSKEHNIKLCKIAKSRGWKLKAGGEGLVDERGNLIANTEYGILKALLGRYVPPEERE